MLKTCQSDTEQQGDFAGLVVLDYTTQYAGRGTSVKERIREFAQEESLPEGAWWLSAQEIAEALRVSRRHVFALIQDGSFDCTLDLRAGEARQPYWRVWRRSFARFGQRARGEACGRVRLEAEWSEALSALPAALTGLELASHFRCSKQHIYNLADEFANVGTLEAERSLVRVSRAELMGFIRKRMV